MFARAVARKGLKPMAKKALLSLRIDSDVVEVVQDPRFSL